MKELRSPLDETAVRRLKIGEIVYLSGGVITGRDGMHIRAIEHSRSGKPVPEGIKGSVLFHCGPIVEKEGNGWKVIAAGPTTSARMDALGPEMIRRFGIRAVIGKGGMSKEIGDAMREVGCVYLAAVGGTAVSIAESVAEVCGVEWEDLGMAEAVWSFRMDRMGPLVVAMDSEGGCLYEDIRSKLVRY
ncbi:MAG: FumA C-terminus/TtdB family hydratase beta subunit [Methanomassiliicoccaceae archaeon]|nr:FumA C-terminus/TtdB family hydratase beta subunit [Methanomassiliicoccaceae archaeon]MCL2145590.1 FumA C-terminus/TtdB family hydratase beta subunit [Methanomassiliicoccaceae archaeon]